MPVGTSAIELCVFKKKEMKNMDKKGKLILGISSHLVLLYEDIWYTLVFTYLVP